MLQVFRHCPTDLRDSDSFKAYITCAVFSGDGQEVEIFSSLSLFLYSLACTIQYIECILGAGQLQ